jgi:arginase
MADEAVPDHRSSVELISAPWSIGLRPNEAGDEPGTWRAPRALCDAGLQQRLGAVVATQLPRPPYRAEAQPGTRIRNGLTLREHSLLLADAVDSAITAGRLPVVIGGDCSVLPGCLVGLRRHHGEIALVHVDGHTDFKHPATWDFTTLGTGAGMDLALATGRGELLLTHWPGIGRPLVQDRHVVQIGDRTGQALPPGLLVLGIDELLATGVDAAALRAVDHLPSTLPIWLHVDLDVLDASVLPAVDTPGTPGLGFEELTRLLSRLRRSGRVAGADITIYDPQLDPDAAYPAPIVDCIAHGLTGVTA